MVAQEDVYTIYYIWILREFPHRQSKNGTLRVICQSLPTKTTTTMSIIMQFGIVSFGISILPRQLQVCWLCDVKIWPTLCQKFFQTNQNNIKCIKWKIIMTIC